MAVNTPPSIAQCLPLTTNLVQGGSIKGCTVTNWTAWISVEVQIFRRGPVGAEAGSGSGAASGSGVSTSTGSGFDGSGSGAS